MSFLIDPVLLYAGGRTYRRLTASDRSAPPAPAPPAAVSASPAPVPAPARDAAVAAAFMAVFWGVSVGLYLDRPWTRPVWRLCRARSGRDWMLNSGVLRLDAERAGPRTHAIAALLFAAYPLWLWRGLRRQPRRGS